MTIPYRAVPFLVPAISHGAAQMQRAQKQQSENR